MPKYRLTDGDDDFNAATAVPPFTDGSIVVALAGDDTIEVEGDNLLIEGGSDDDLILASGDNNTLDGGKGNDTIAFDGSNNVAFGGDGNDEIDGGNGDDNIRGNAGNDDLFGSDGNDRIVGGTGKDKIEGGDNRGDDDFVFANKQLIEFSEGDLLTGGGGRDAFRYDATDDDHQVVTDFTVGEDRLKISDAATVEQKVLTGGVYGPGLLVYGTGETDNAIFLQGVDQKLTVGTDIILTDGALVV